MARKPIPKKLKYKIMYDSQYVCSVCQQKGCQTHHIDGDNSNNTEDNLIFLCNTHHDEAHTKRQLSQNLNAKALKDAKKKWLATVKDRRESVATMTGQTAIANNDFASVGVTWGYINHKRIGQLADPNRLDPDNKSYFDYCERRGIVDSKGILIKPNSVALGDNYIHNSVYDWYEHGDDQRLHLAYTSFTDQISRMVEPIHIENDGWSKAKIRELVEPGNFIFLERGFYFKCIEETELNQHRKVHTFKNSVSIEFYVDTMDMFGTTSMTVSFEGHKTCAAFLQIKSIEETKDKKLILHCTPIALGVGFNKKW